MTYQEALKARARLAYSATGLVKSAAPKTQDELVTESLMLQDAAGRKTKEKGAEMQSKANEAGAKYDQGKRDAATAAAQAASDRANLVDKVVSLYGNGSGAAGVTMEEEMMNDSRKRNERQLLADEEAARLAKRNLGIGAGAGALAGLGTAGAAYGLAGLFPSLKKRRLLRALIALSAGGAAGLGVGYGVNAGLNSGKIQGAYGTAKSRGLAALDALRGGQAQA